ncbi:hypothetical protein ROZALSC1DRAFT_31398 [Rozella allomycis CSF55]|uniref:Uncharacterized protein n=1 Tax=Rozella allomycis (strain CSF55) TaxID=988480 RepID=A0A4P9YBP1_ROZAC|nr:hypothetical protein ROZALSC1DRAFT_31398 [Rozella allomycis CSF55]
MNDWKAYLYFERLGTEYHPLMSFRNLQISVIEFHNPRADLRVLAAIAGMKPLKRLKRPIARHPGPRETEQISNFKDLDLLCRNSLIFKCSKYFNKTSYAPKPKREMQESSPCRSSQLHERCLKGSPDIINVDLRPRDSLRVSLVPKRVDSGLNPFAASNEGEKGNNTRNNVSGKDDILERNEMNMMYFNPEPEELVTTPKKTKEPCLSPILQSPWMKNTSLKLEETVGDQETTTLWSNFDQNNKVFFKCTMH